MNLRPVLAWLGIDQGYSSKVGFFTAADYIQQVVFAPLFRSINSDDTRYKQYSISG